MKRLGELIESGVAELQTGPFGTSLHASAYRPVGTPVVAVQHVGDGALVHKDLPLISAEDVERLSRYKLRTDDVVFCRKGAVERRALIKTEESGWLQGSDCIRLRVDPSQICARFLSYQIGSSRVRSWLVQHASGATMPSLNQGILKNLPLILPSLPVQRQISEYLGALDDKIELNRRMNKTLEGMARALFKAWFVDFEPVRAKAEGRPTGLPADLDALFPSEFEDSPLGEIPKGWAINPISELCDVVGGGTPSTKNPQFWDGEFSWVTPKDLSRLVTPVLLRSERTISSAGLGTISSGLLPLGTVLMSSRAPIGYLAIAQIPVAINQGFIAMKPRADVSCQFLLRWAEANQDTIISRANGSTFLEISKANFKPIEVVTPPVPVMSCFDEQASALYQQVACNEQEVLELQALRDDLLPRLLSGEVEVAEAEELVTA